jgi:hypothetical protein
MKDQKQMELRLDKTLAGFYNPSLTSGLDKKKDQKQMELKPDKTLAGFYNPSL